jgi:WD40 repeat protein/tRNA A-37 threonylcarbamoyl transferase component Bud32
VLPAEHNIDRDEQIAALYGRWKQLAEQGQSVSPEELCRDAPELLDEFLKVLPRLKALDGLFDDKPEHQVAPGVKRDFHSVSYYKEGGLGVVFVTEDPELKRQVAIKCLKANLHADRQAIERFIEEAEVTARLEHPGVVPIYRLSRGGDDQPYYAMRFVQGETLAQSIRRFHQWPKDSPERSLEFRRLLLAVVTVCETIAYAHTRGVVHRDIKPDNIILGPFGETLVLDWGLAKHTQRSEFKSGEGQTAAESAETIDYAFSITGQAKGSPAFMSPEQARGEPTVGPASDVFCLGATLYALLAGQPPYAGGSVLELIDKARQATPPPPRRLNPEIAKPLEAICMRAMSADPAQRYASPLDLVKDINRWLADEPVSVYPETVASRLRRWAKRHRALVLTGAISLTLVALAAIGLAIQGRRHNRALQRINQDLREAYEQQQQANYLKTVSLASRDLQDGDAWRALELLADCDPPRRNWEWHFLKREAEANYRLWTYPGEVIVDIEMSPSGQYFATLIGSYTTTPDLARKEAIGDVQVAILDSQSGEVLQLIDIPSFILDSPLNWATPDLRISHDGNLVAISSSLFEGEKIDGAVRCFDKTKDWEPVMLQADRFPGRVVKGIFFDRQNTLYALTQAAAEAANRDEKIEYTIVNCHTGEDKLKFKAGFRQRLPQLDPNDSVLLLGGRGITTIDFRTGEPVGDEMLPPGYVRSFQLSSDRKLVACVTEAGHLVIFDFASRQKIREIYAHAEGAFDLGFCAKNQVIISGGRDGLMKRWRISDGELLHKVTLGGGVPYVAVNFESGEAIAPVTMRKLACWSSQASHVLRRKDPAIGPTVRSPVFFSPDGTRIFAAEGKLTVWEADSRKELCALEFPKPHGAVWCAPTMDGKRVVVHRASVDTPDQYDPLQIWDVDQQQRIVELPRTKSRPEGFAWDQKEQQIVVVQNDSLTAFDAQTAEQKWEVAAPFPSYPLARPKANEIYLVESDFTRTQRIAAVDASSGKTLRQFDPGIRRLVVTNFSFDGQLLLAYIAPADDNSFRPEVVILHAETGKVKDRYQLSSQPDTLVTLFLSNDGTRLFAQSIKEVLVYDQFHHELIMTIRNQNETVDTFTLNAQGLGVARTHSGGGILLWDGRPEKTAQQAGDQPIEPKDRR